MADMGPGLRPEGADGGGFGQESVR
jgi:hypothetical protein